MNDLVFFKALSDETRLRILNLVLFQELNVNELVKILNMGQSRISRHLKILNDGGLLTARREGLWVFYGAQKNGEGRKFINSISYLLKGNETYENDLAQAGVILQEGRRETRRFFDSLAPDWDALKRDIIGKFDLTGEILKRLKKCRTAVDLGCGTGAFLPELIEKAEMVIGVDSSPRMLEHAHRRFHKDGKRIQLRIGELEHLPLRDEEVDYAIINLVLHHLPVPAAGIREAYRVLKRGQSLIVIDFDKHQDESMRSRYGDRWLGFSHSEMENWIEEAGFRNDERSEFPLKRGLTLVLYLATKLLI